jgi:hypothetical protein
VPVFLKPAVTDSMDLLIDRPQRPSHLGPDGAVRQLSASIESLNVPKSLQYADAYLQCGADARLLMGALPLAAARSTRACDQLYSRSFKECSSRHSGWRFPTPRRGLYRRRRGL